MSSSQSPPASPTSPTASRLPSADAVAAAAETRLRQASGAATAAQLLQLHEKKQKFRRMIEPGIMRPNGKDQAMSSLKTLLTIAENLIREPDNPKFQRFKPTNTVIKRELVDRKGTLEYAIELGFRPEVENFQPYYKFHQRYMDDLKIGTQILKEFLQLHQEKEERATLAKKTEKAAIEAAHEKVKLAFIDDRKTKSQRDEIEKQARDAREAVRQVEGEASSSDRQSHSRSASVEATEVGEGRVLGETAPPPYEG